MTTETLEPTNGKDAKAQMEEDILSLVSEIVPPVEVPKEPPPMPASVKKEVPKELPPTPASTKKDLSITKMKVKDLVLADNWNRDKLQGIDKLVQSIITEGQGVPITVYFRSDGKAEIIDGRRRYAALKEAGITEARVVVDPTCCDAETAERRSLMLNLAREGHTPLELCRNFARARDQGNKVRDIARFSGWSEAQVSQYLKLEVLPEEAKKLLAAEKIDFTAARALGRLNFDETKDLKLFDKIIAKVKDGEYKSANIVRTIEVYFDKKQEADRAAGKKAKKTSGKKAAVTKEYYDYSDKDYLKHVKPRKAPEVGRMLNLLQDRKNAARTPQGRAFEDGCILGVQMCAGLADLEGDTEE